MSTLSPLRRAAASVAALALLASSLVVVDGVRSADPAAAGDDGSLDLSFGGPAEILLGETATYTLAATNNAGGGDLYNVSYRLVLPPGATIDSSDLGAPDIEVDDAPAAGQTTFVWINVEDLQANVTKSHTVSVDFAHPTWDVNDLPELTAGAYASGDARQIPDFNADGSHNDTTDTTAFDTQTDQTNIIAIRITKEEPNAESELLRGVHDEWTTYSLTIQNNYVNPSDTIVVDDYLPAGLEFLECGSIDNTTATPVTNLTGATTEEYVGAGDLGVGVVPSDPTGGPTAICIAPDTVETVTLTADEVAPGQPAGVYTHVQWIIDAGSGVEPGDDGRLLAGENFELMYAAGIPLRQNEMFGGGFSPNTTGEQTANLDNNTGALTADEQQWENWSLVNGQYDPDGLDLPAQDEDAHIVIAEDLSIHKSVDTGTFVQGDVSRWTLLIETGEYRDASALVVTDTLPDGLCPLRVSGNPETAGTINAECDAQGGEEPTTAGLTDAIDIVTENADGSWTLVWNTLPTMTESDDFTIEFSTVAREFYQEGNEDDLPVVAGDSWTNDVHIIGTTDPLDDGDGNEPDRALEFDTIDVSSAGQSTQTVIITKRISEAETAGTLLDCDTATYVQSTYDATDAIPFMDQGYKPGDRVCYRLDVDFTLGLDFRNPQVTDFIPPNTTFERYWGIDLATGATAANEATIDGAEAVDFPVNGVTDGRTDAIVWTLGSDIATDDGGPNAADLYVDETSDNFQVVFSVIVDGDPRDAAEVDITENLAKLTHQNSAHLGGETYSSRDLADFPFVEPHLSLDKTNALSGDSLDDDPETAVQGNVVDYEVEVSNDVAPTGDAAQDAHAAALNIPVWDILPALVDCSFLSSIAVAGPDGAITATCYDDGDGGYPLTGQSTEGRSVVEYTIPRLDPGESASLTYEITIPADFAAGIVLTNDAGVRAYDQETDNTGDDLTYVPADNIDEDAPTSNIAAVDDQAVVNIDTIDIEKRQTSSVTETDNRSNTPSATNTQDATIGETITYDFTITIPQGVDLYNAVFTDPLDSEISFVSLDTGTFSTDDGATSTTLTIDDGPNGDGHFDLGGAVGHQAATDILVELVGDTLTITMPTTWQNGPAALDDVLDLQFTVVVDNAAGVESGDNVDNRVYADWDTELSGGVAIEAQSNRARTKVVEPDLSIEKVDDGTDTDTPTDDISNVVSGQAIDFVVTVHNDLDDDNGDASFAHDVTVTDILPLGMTFDAFPAGNPDGGVFTPNVPVGTAGTITWTIDSIEKGASVDLEYAVTVDTELVAAAQLTNTARAITTSLDGAATERDSSNDPTGNGYYDVTATNTVELPLGLIAKDIGPAGATDQTEYAVGEAADFTVTITIPDGVRTYDTTVYDLLPAFLEFDAYGTISIGSGACELAGTDTDLTAGDITTLTPDGQTLGWWLDDIEADGGDCSITFAYTTHVDSAATATSAGDNRATLQWHDSDDITTDPDEVTDLGGETWDEETDPVVESLEVIEPDLTIDKDVVLLDPGETVCEAAPDADACDTVVGATHRFTLTIDNGGDGPAHDLTVIDTLPTDGTDVPFNLVGGIPLYEPVTRTLTWTIPGPIAAGGSIELEYDVTVGTSDEVTDDEDLVNTADIPTYYGLSTADRAAAPDSDDVPVYGGTRNPVDDDSVTLTVAFPDLVIEKEHGPGMDPTDARVGQLYTWDLVVTSIGDVPAYDIDVTDTLPTGWEYVPGSARIDTGSGFGALADPSGGVTGPLEWTDVVGSLDTAETFTIRLDTVPTAAAVSIATTGSFDHVNDAGVSGDDATGESSNATGAYGDDDGAGQGPYASDDNAARIRRVDLEVDKAIVESAPHHYGENITYRITVTNDHPTEIMDTATGVTVRDTLPDGVIFVSAAAANGTYDDGTGIWTLATPLADGGSASLDIVVRINSADPITNRAEVETSDLADVDSEPGDHDDGTGPDEDDDDGVTFTPVSADLGNRVWFDLDADGRQDAGEPGIAGVTVSATWIDPDDGVTVVTRTTVTDGDGEYGFDDLPRNVDITVTIDTDSLPGGMSQTFELTDDPVLTDPQADNANAGALDGEVTEIELDSGTPSYPDVDFGYVGTGAIGDTVWHDDDADGELDPGEAPIAGVDVTVTWAGVDGLIGTDDDVTFTDTTDADGEYLIGNLPAGEYRVAIDPATLPTGLVPTHDLDGADDRTADATLGAGETRLDLDFGERLETDLEIEKTSGGEFAVGSENTWTITVTNNGPAATGGTLTVTDTLPAGTTFVRADTTAWACAATGQTVTCAFVGTLDAGDDATLPLIVDVDVETGGGTLTNSASVDDIDGNVDPDPTNDDDDDTVDVPLAILDIEKNLIGTALFSDRNAAWQIDVTNLGPSATTGPVTVVDDLPAGLSYVGSEGDAFDCSAVGQRVTCVADDTIAVDETIVLRLITLVTADPGVAISNEASIAGGTLVGGDLLPEDVLDDIRDDLADPDGGLDDALGVAVPSTGVEGDDATASTPALAFTGVDPVGLLAIAMTLFVLGLAVTVFAQRRRPGQVR